MYIKTNPNVVVIFCNWVDQGTLIKAEISTISHIQNDQNYFIPENDDQLKIPTKSLDGTKMAANVIFMCHLEENTHNTEK